MEEGLYGGSDKYGIGPLRMQGVQKSVTYFLCSE